MGISRSQAMTRIEGLAAQITAHLKKVRNDPFSVDYNHWRQETQGLIRQIRVLSRHVGRRTQTEVLNRVAQWSEIVGNGND